MPQTAVGCFRLSSMQLFVLMRFLTLHRVLLPSAQTHAFRPIMGAFTDCAIAIAGTFKGRKQGRSISQLSSIRASTREPKLITGITADVQKLITSNDGTFHSAVTPVTTTHLITTPTDLAKRGPKVKAALDKNQNVLIVGIEWLDECVEQKERVDETEYLLNKAEKDDEGNVEMGDSQASNGSFRRSSRATRAGSVTTAESQGAQDSAPAPAPVAGKKRGRAAAKQETIQEEPEEGKEEESAGNKKDADVEMKDADEEKPAKRARGRKAAAAALSAPVPAPPAPAKRGRAAAKAASQADTTIDVKADADADAAPAAAPAAAPSAPAKKGKGKGKAKQEAEPEPEPEPKKKEDPPAKIKTVEMGKGTAPVDEYFPQPQGWFVYVDDQGVIYDGSLNQTDIGKNSNKFYYVQLLEQRGNIKSYATWTRWGRVGEMGQSSMVAGKGSSLANAMWQFEKKFKDKTGLNWAQRFDPPKPKKYTYVLKNYAESDSESEDEEASKGKGKEKEKEEAPIPESKIHKSLRDLMGLIFNTNFMQQQMISMSYDANKLPLGKLSKTTLNQGFLVLKAIGELINQPSLAQQQYDCSIGNAYLLLTNRYYSVIPHAFGRNVPPVINSSHMLKREVELIESLGDMQIATEVIKNTKHALDKDGNPMNPIDQQFESLGLEEAVPLDRNSTEFKNLKGYLARTHGKTHHIKLRIEDIFRIERQGEAQRFKDAGFDTLANDNRYLLWHGSRATNFAGILSQGLRIAPPEAPVNGYMFGKGIYLADMVTKSANYCCARDSDSTGLLMLCEAQLGDPMFELSNADCHAATNSKNAGALATKGKGRSAPTKWMDAGKVHRNLEGVKMPDINADPEDLADPGLYLQYNEVSFDIYFIRVSTMLTIHEVHCL